VHTIELLPTPQQGHLPFPLSCFGTIMHYFPFCGVHHYTVSILSFHSTTSCKPASLSAIKLLSSAYNSDSRPSCTSSLMTSIPSSQTAIAQYRSLCSRPVFTSQAPLSSYAVQTTDCVALYSQNHLHQPLYSCFLRAHLIISLGTLSLRR